MKRIAWIAAVAAACGTAADAPGVHADYESLFTSAQQTGRAVLIVYMQQTTCPIANSARDFVLKDATNLRFLNQHFEVAEIAWARGDRRMGELLKNVKGRFIPMWVVASPDGEFIDGGDANSIDQGRNSKWRQRIGQIAAGHPPVGAKDREKAAEILAQARSDLQAGRFDKAHQSAEKVRKLVWYPKKLSDEAAAIVGEVDQRGQKDLAAADELAQQEKFLDAAVAYDGIATSFTSKLPAGRAAAEKLRKLLASHREVVQEFDRRRRIARAETLLGQAKALEEQGKSAAARQAYSTVARQYADTPSAATAKEALARLSPAGAAPAEATTRPADAPPPPGADQIKLAKAYYVAGMKDKARQRLQDVIRAHPDSPAAAEARKLLAEWKLAAQ